MSGWKAGDKAVCVDDSPGINTGTKALKKGTIYLVECARLSMVDGRCLLDLSGITLPPHPTPGRKFGFCAKRFRKVVTASEREAIGMARLMEDLLR